MDRFVSSSTALNFAECELWRQKGVCLYDGDSKNTVDGGAGLLILTNHRLLWQPVSDARGCLALSLSLVVLVDTEEASMFHSAKIKLTLSAINQGVHSSGRGAQTSNHVRLSFRSSGMRQMHGRLMAALERCDWQKTAGFAAPAASGPTAAAATTGCRAAGIVGIEKRMLAAQTSKQREISGAFADLDRLMTQARKMVAVARQLSEQVRERRGAITDDETVQLQAHLLSLGVENDVTEDEEQQDEKTRMTGGFHHQLARQLSSSLEPAVRAAGGLITLTDAYCRVNRARGLELLAPGDLLAACRLMRPPGAWPLHCRTLSCGVRVLQLPQLDDTAVVEETRRRLVSETASQRGLSSERLAKQAEVPVLLAAQWLDMAEKRGVACRDDSPEGLVFFFNKLLHPDTQGGDVREDERAVG